MMLETFSDTDHPKADQNPITSAIAKKSSKLAIPGLDREVALSLVEELKALEVTATEIVPLLVALESLNDPNIDQDLDVVSAHTASCRGLIATLIRDTDESLAPYAVLFDAYEPRCLYYELVETSRRLLLTAVLIVTAPGSLSQIVLGFVASVFYGLLGKHHMPFVDEADDSFANWGQMAVGAVAFQAILLHATADDDGSDTDTFVGIALVSLHASVAMVLAVQIFFLWKYGVKEISKAHELATKAASSPNVAPASSASASSQRNNARKATPQQDPTLVFAHFNRVARASRAHDARRSISALHNASGCHASSSDCHAVGPAAMTAATEPAPAVSGAGDVAMVAIRTVPDDEHEGATRPASPPPLRGVSEEKTGGGGADDDDDDGDGDAQQLEEPPELKLADIYTDSGQGGGGGVDNPILLL